MSCLQFRVIWNFAARSILVCCMPGAPEIIISVWSKKLSLSQEKRCRICETFCTENDHDRISRQPAAHPHFLQFFVPADHKVFAVAFGVSGYHFFYLEKHTHTHLIRSWCWCVPPAAEFVHFCFGPPPLPVFILTIPLVPALLFILSLSI